MLTTTSPSFEKGSGRINRLHGRVELQSLMLFFHACVSASIFASGKLLGNSKTIYSMVFAWCSSGNNPQVTTTIGCARANGRNLVYGVQIGNIFAVYIIYCIRIYAVYIFKQDWPTLMIWHLA